MRSTTLRRPLLILAAAAVAVSATVLPALAAAVTWTSPGPGAVVTGPVDLVVRVDRELGESVAGVAVRLSDDGERTAPGTATRDLVCVEADGCNVVTRRDDRWGGVRLAPDGGELASGPVCNGRYLLQARPAGAEPWSGTSVVLSDPTVHAVTGFTADGEPREARLTWTPRAASADVRLRIERRPEGAASWDLVTVLVGTASAFTDRGVAAGGYDYRVVATRGDGLVGGEPAPACSDQEPDLTAASAVRSVTVAPGPAPTSAAAPEGGPAGQDPTDGGGGDTTVSEGPGDGSGTTGGSRTAGSGTAGDGMEGSGTAGEGGGPAPGTTASSGAPRTRVAAPPPPARTGTSVDAPRIAPPPAAAGEGTAFGEDGPFSEELDYGGLDAVAADPADDPVFLDRVVPGGWRSITELDLDLRRLLTSIAGGLVLMATGLHVRRWMGEARD